MTKYASYSLGVAEITVGYDARKAEQLLRAQPGYHRVDFFNRGDHKRLPVAEVGVIQYVKATGGKWGKSARIEYGGPFAGEPVVAAIMSVT